jgi:three-Cys-motif partner protein
MGEQQPPVPHTRRPRTWGVWSELKLEILKRYLTRFTTAAKRSPACVYIDAFAGTGTGVSRTTEEPFDGSPRIALQTQPPFTHLFFCEMHTPAAYLQRALANDFPDDRRYRVTAGDCNGTIPQVLQHLRAQNLGWAPTFAFVDPDGMEVDFNTLRSLAEHKRGYRKGSSRPEFKVELWLLFPSPAIERVVSKERRDNITVAESRATRLFGSTEWAVVHDLRTTRALEASQARTSYVELMRWRLETVLGYRWAHALEMQDLVGRPVYHMILATDHPAGTEIMSHLYGWAVRAALPRYDQAKQQLTGQPRLFDMPPITSKQPAGYRYEQPLPPLHGN